MSLLERRRRAAALAGRKTPPGSFKSMSLDVVAEDTPLSQIMDRREEFGVPKPPEASKGEIKKLLMRVENAALCDKGIQLGGMIGSGQSNEVFTVRRISKDGRARSAAFDVLMRTRTMHYPPEDEDKLKKDLQGLLSVFVDEIRVTRAAAEAGCGPEVEDAWICAYRKKEKEVGGKADEDDDGDDDGRSSSVYDGGSGVRLAMLLQVLPHKYDWNSVPQTEAVIRVIRCAAAAGIVNRDLHRSNFRFDGSGRAYMIDYEYAFMSESQTQQQRTHAMIEALVARIQRTLMTVAMDEPVALAILQAEEKRARSGEGADASTVATSMPPPMPPAATAAGLRRPMPHRATTARRAAPPRPPPRAPRRR